MTIAICSTSTPAAQVARSGPGPAKDGRRVSTDSWLDAVAKLIPGEMIVVFQAADHLLGLGDDRGAHLVVLLVCAALCPLALWASARRACVAAHWLQHVVRNTIFVLYGLGDDAVLRTWLDELAWLPTLGLPVVAVLAALVLSPPGAQQTPTTAFD